MTEWPIVRDWKSLWGATIEAIAKAWGVPLDAVLDASEFATRDRPAMRDVGRHNNKPVKLDTDLIRHPSLA